MPPRSAKSEGAKWKARLDAARASRKAQEGEWRANRAALLGRASTTPRLRRGDAVNLAWAAFQTLVGQVYARNPDPLIRETDPLLGLAARTLTAMTIEDFEEMRVRYPIRLAMADVFWAGFGIVHEKVETDITSTTFKFSEDDKEREIAVPGRQRMKVERLHPEMVLFDPVGMMPDLSDQKWVSLQFFPTVKELRDDPLFEIDEKTLKGLPRIKSSPAMRERVTDYWAKANDDPDDEFAQVACEEILDRVNKEYLYMPCGTDKVIGKRDWPVELRYNGELLFPLSLLYFNENPDEFWPIPEISMVRPQLEQYSAFFRWILVDAMTKWRRFVARGDMFDKAQLDKLTSGGETQVVTWNPKMLDPAAAAMMDSAKILTPLIDPAAKADQSGVLNLVKQTIYEIMGSGDFASAGFRSTRSATEAAALSDFMRTRMGNRTENVDAFFHRMVVVHVLFLQDQLVTPRDVRVANDDGIEVWRQVTKDDIEGRFKFSIVAGSSAPQNTETRRQENIAFMQQILPIIMQTGGDPRAAIEWIAPYYKMPQSTLDRTWRNQRQLWMEVALQIKKAYMGQPVDPTAFMDIVSAAVNASLSPSEIATIDQAVAQQTAKQPVSPAGTNPSRQTLPT